MDDNQVIAALQIENSEIRILVGQFFNDSFNVLLRHTGVCRGMDGISINDESKAVESIRSAVNEVSVKLNAPLQSVLLIIPAHRFKKEKRSVDLLLEDHVVGYGDVRKIIREACRTNVGSDYEIINATSASYKINSISYPRIPLGEKGDMLSSEVDLICGDRLITHDYVMLVEKAGLKVMDICQDGYAGCREAAIFEQSFNRYVVNIYISGCHSVYSLICNGRLAAGFSVNKGYNSLIRPIMDKYHLSYREASRLLFRYGHIGQESGENRLINRWKDGDVEYSITYDKLQKCIQEAAESFVYNICSYCRNIAKFDDLSVIITGQGASLQDLDKVLQQNFERDVVCYCPDKLGVRETRWTALLGIFYEYKENEKIAESRKSSLDIDVYRQHLLPEEEDQEDENSITGRLKSITDKLFVEDDEDDDENS
ncbi:MAG: hypothetical protein IJM79_00730 [Erysipelotrichaceae bacterium]|nr:hypothetical protein [Erysipelotrichaceae bacterium]